MRAFFRAAGILTAAIALVQEPARAQDEEVDVAIGTGFTPDPLRLTGTTIGAEPMSARAPGCRGYVGGAPDRVLRLDTRFGFLRFFVTASSDVTLALRGPDGQWRCAGRPLAGAPREQGRYAPGRYEVWIGSVERGAQVAYELAVTEFRSVGPATGRTDEARAAGGQEIGLDVRAEAGRYRNRRLRRGFLPDPREDGGTAGGSIDVALIGGGCRGHVGGQPNHVLTLRDELDYFRIAVREAGAPVTLVVRTPSGGYLCSAPDGLPSVEQDAWTEGRYLIWVGSREPGATPDYRLQYTETRAPSE